MNPPDPLSQLRGLALPDAISWWPPAAGWWILLFLFILLSVGLWYFLRKRYVASRWRKSALSELQMIKVRHQQGDGKNAQTLALISVLFRRSALVVHNREEIAGLNGQVWLEKLDQLMGNSQFTQGAGRILADHVWQKPEQLKSLDLTSLIDLLEQFIVKTKVHND